MRRALTWSLLAHLTLLTGLVLLRNLPLPHSRERPRIYSVRLVGLPPGPPGGGSRAQAEKPRTAPAHKETTPPLPREVKRVKTPRREVPKREVEEEALPVPAAGSDIRGPEGAPGGGAGVGGLRLEGGEFHQFGYYIEAFVSKIQSNWHNPVAGEERKATVYFRIQRGGRLADVRLEESSGDFRYDQAALRAVISSNPLPPLPEEYEGDYLGVYCDIFP